MYGTLGSQFFGSITAFSPNFAISYTFVVKLDFMTRFRSAYHYEIFLIIRYLPS